MEACPMMKRFFNAGFSSGTRFRRPARGYERRKEVISLTVTAVLVKNKIAATSKGGKGL